MPQPTPTVLSLAPTGHCELNCSCCYLHKPWYGAPEKDLNFFRSLLHESSSCGFKEVAMSVNKFSHEADKNCVLLRELSKEARNLRLRFSVTTNYENVERFGGAIYRRCALVSLSYDEFKFRSQTRLPNLIHAVQTLRDYVPAVNINLLLTRHLIQDLKQGLLGTFLQHADSVYFLLPKGYPSDFTRGELLEFVAWLLPLLNDFEIFRRVSLDNCAKPFIHPFCSVYSKCERGSEIVAIGPGGEIGFSVFDPPYMVLSDPAQFSSVLQQMFTSSDGGEHLGSCQSRSFCPFILFRQIPMELSKGSSKLNGVYACERP